MSVVPERLVTQAEAAEFYDFSLTTMGEYASKAPPDCVRMKGRSRKRLLVFPNFPKWFRYYRDQQPPPTTDLDELRQRRAKVDLEIAEMSAAKMRGELVSAEDFDQTVDALVDRVRGTLLNVPNRFATRTVGLDSLRQSQAVWDQAMREVLKTLSDGGDTSAA